jgi:hypothetical protein
MNTKKQDKACVYVQSMDQISSFLHLPLQIIFKTSVFGASAWKSRAVIYHVLNTLSLVIRYALPHVGKQVNSNLLHLPLRQFITSLV